MTGQEFRQYRVHTLKLSCEGLAGWLGVTRQTVHNWENMAEIPVLLELALPELTRRVRQSPQVQAV